MKSHPIQMRKHFNCYPLLGAHLIHLKRVSLVFIQFTVNEASPIHFKETYCQESVQSILVLKCLEASFHS